jgi:hypothetical protein
MATNLTETIMTNTVTVLPMIHTCGTAAGELMRQASALKEALEVALEALRQAAPNQRDYYPMPGVWDMAVRQHQERVKALESMMDSVTEQQEQACQAMDAL